MEQNTIKIAVVEDEAEQAELLNRYLVKYAGENGAVFEVKIFSNAVTFLENYSADYDIVFMDIKMPYMDGMTAAHKLRELDSKVLLYFITSLTQYAVQGYEVDALNYIIKPVKYEEFALKFKKAMTKLQDKKTLELLVPVTGGIKKLLPQDIYYVEVRGHYCKYHTTSGEYEHYRPIKEIEKQLAPYNFVRCNNCYLVNLYYVTSIKKLTVTVGKEELQISHPRAKEFTRRFLQYMEEGGASEH